MICDGSKSHGCLDGDDEENCELYTCLDDYIKCGNLRTCISVSINPYYTFLDYSWLVYERSEPQVKFWE